MDIPEALVNNILYTLDLDRKRLATVLSRLSGLGGEISPHLTDINHEIGDILPDLTHLLVLLRQQLNAKELALEADKEVDAKKLTDWIAWATISTMDKITDPEIKLIECRITTRSIV